VSSYKDLESRDGSNSLAGGLIGMFRKAKDKKAAENLAMLLVEMMHAGIITRDNAAAELCAGKGTIGSLMAEAANAYSLNALYGLGALARHGLVGKASIKAAMAKEPARCLKRLHTLTRQA